MNKIIEEIIGRIPVAVVQTDDTIAMSFADGAIASWYHVQDCCELVIVDDVVGEWADLYGHPLLIAEERVSDDCPGLSLDHPCHYEDSNTWTFYTFRNLGGSVDVRWHGSSNGYYSERVEFTLTQPGEA